MEGKPITKWCRHYFSKSGCERGQYCTFAHDKSQLGKTYIHREKWSSTHKMVLCRYFAAGQPCKASCAFAHGAAELGTPASKSSENQERPRPSSQTRPANAVSKTIPRAACPDWEAYQFEDGRWRWGWSSWGGWEGTKTQESKTPEQPPPPPPGRAADDDQLPPPPPVEPPPEAADADENSSQAADAGKNAEALGKWLGAETGAGKSSDDHDSSQAAEAAKNAEDLSQQRPPSAQKRAKSNKIVSRAKAPYPTRS